MTERESLFQNDFLLYATRQYVACADELYHLPKWAWKRRRSLLSWRRHYAGRIADEIEALYIAQDETDNADV